MKYPLVLTLIACVTLLTVNQNPSGSAADQKCTLTPAQAPEIRGVRLGMTVEQLQSLFPEKSNLERINNAVRESKQPQSYGRASLQVQRENEVSNPRFEGVNVIYIGLLDERVTDFQVGYSKVEWKNVDQFVERLSAGLRLPKLFWEQGDGGSNRSMVCNGFRVNAYAFATASSVRVWDTSVDQVVEGRKEAEREKGRQAFKP